MKLLFSIIMSFLSVASIVYSQIEHVPISHPVYDLLLRAETKGLLPHYSLSSLPLQRKEIVNALKLIRKLSNTSDVNFLNSVEKFEIEFQIKTRENSVVFYSDSDSNQVFFSGLFTHREKYLYRYSDSLNTICISPLAAFDAIIQTSDISSSNVSMGTLGFRFYGSLGVRFGYFLQVTNGSIFAGSRDLALNELNALQQNIKFADLNSDFDFTESHIRFDYDWFYAIIGRESRLLGSGLIQRGFISTNAPPFDALSIGAKFNNFEYRFTHGSLIGIPDTTGQQVGAFTSIPPKFNVMHRFSLRPTWGEISFWESIIYSDRYYDLAYLNPLSFFKSLEHALRDRDNSLMGIDATIRPYHNFQFKGSFLLDDIVFGKLGDGYWSNKWAWNLALIYSPDWPLDFGIEYSKVEPYTFSHFREQKSVTNDQLLYAGYLPPNSDQLTLLARYWFGERYPLTVKFNYLRHGDNEYDANGNLIRNVGGDPRYVFRAGIDTEPVVFLDGDRKDIKSIELSTGYEVFRGFNIQGRYSIREFDGIIDNLFRIIIRYDDF